MASAWPGQRGQVGGARLSSNSSHAAPSSTGIGRSGPQGAAKLLISTDSSGASSLQQHLPHPRGQQHPAALVDGKGSRFRKLRGVASTTRHFGKHVHAGKKLHIHAHRAGPATANAHPIASTTQTCMHGATRRIAPQRHCRRVHAKVCATSWKMPKQGPHGHSDYACATRTDFRRHREKVNVSGACDLQSGTSANASTNGCERRACDGKARTTARRVSRSSMGFIRCCANATTVQHQRTKLLRQDIAGRQ